MQDHKFCLLVSACRNIKILPLEYVIYVLKIKTKGCIHIPKGKFIPIVNYTFTMKIYVGMEALTSAFYGSEWSILCFGWVRLRASMGIVENRKPLNLARDQTQFVGCTACTLVIIPTKLSWFLNSTAVINSIGWNYFTLFSSFQFSITCGKHKIFLVNSFKHEVI